MRCERELAEFICDITHDDHHTHTYDITHEEISSDDKAKRKAETHAMHTFVAATALFSSPRLSTSMTSLSLVTSISVR